MIGHYPVALRATVEQHDDANSHSGHGRIFGQADVVEYRDMLVIIRDIIQDQIQRGMTLEQIKAEGSKIVVLCPYVKSYLKRHPEYESLVVEIPQE